jgi:hypothetical protein
MRALLLVLSISGLITLFACQALIIIAPTGRIWLATEPIQCLGNDWERDWLDRHDGDYDSYPRDREPQSEIIKDYYRSQGVEVFEITTKRRKEAVCTACSCPQGFTLYVRVGEGDTKVMLSLGFREESP